MCYYGIWHECIPYACTYGGQERLAVRSSGPVVSYHGVLRTKPCALQEQHMLCLLSHLFRAFVKPCLALVNSPLHKETGANSLMESHSTIHKLAGNTSR